MRIRVTTDRPWDIDTDVLALPITTDVSPDDSLPELDRRLGGVLADYRAMRELDGMAWRSALVRGTEMGADWVIGMGVGAAGDCGRVTIGRLGGALLRRLVGLPVTRLAIHLPAGLGEEGIDRAGLVELVVRGAVEGSADPYAIYREGVEGELPPQLEELTIALRDTDTSPLERAAERGLIIGQGTNRARRLAQRSSNDVSPDVLADEASAIAQEHRLELTVLGPEEAAALGMGMFTAVGRGSDNPSRFIGLRSGKTGQTDSQGRLLAMVGKGVTFDSGGISIKPADRMEEMKMDKTGACTVLAAIDTIARLAPGLPIMAVAPAVENMPGPHSTRPGDVVRALNGKVVEVNNTDAEGRLILGDALTWAERQGATHLVDVATLTGAVERALGKAVTGGFGAPQEWWDEVSAAGARQGERYWQMPLIDEYRADMESWYADFQNSSGAEGSLVKSGLFLREFVTRPWVHLDIAGTAYMRKNTPWAARGATGVSHATLVELALAGM